MQAQQPPLIWIDDDQEFPSPQQAWAATSPAPGLVCAGRTLSAHQVQKAYRQGIFPWFSAGQPVLWWCPDPRMVLKLNDFKISNSLRKTIRRFAKDARCQIRVDSAFKDVIRACARSPRPGQDGTWIVQPMIETYCELHVQGLAHSVEIWIDEQLVGGLYCVAIGKAVFGESMFHRQTDASKIALSALVALCRAQGVVQIDCQQETNHLAAFGAHPIPRSDFLQIVHAEREREALDWDFLPLYWADITN